MNKKIITLIIAVLLIFGCKDNRNIKQVKGLPDGILDSADTILNSSPDFEWMRSARTFIIDGYTYPLYPEIEYDAGKIAKTMADMHANTIRIATSGNNYWLIPGTEFETSPKLGGRDLLAETIAACKPRGIRVVPYFRTGGHIPVEIIKPEWVTRINPKGDTFSRPNLGVESSGLCWNTSYRQAFLDMIEKVVTQYDIDAVYFDAWMLFYRINRQHGYGACYCEGCTSGFKNDTGLELPYREDENKYTEEELEIFKKYGDWYRDELWEVFQEAKRIVRSHKNIPLISNFNNPIKLINGDPRIIDGCDGILYETGESMLDRAEGNSLAIAQGLTVWPYAGTYDGYPRLAYHQKEIAQEIFTSVAFGGAPILYHTYCYVEHPEGRKPVKEAFSILDRNEVYIENFRPQPYCAVVWNNDDPPGHARVGMLWEMNARSSSQGAFAACLYNHTQVSSILQQNLDNLEALIKYKVLYLPGVCHLTDKQADNIREFVRQGGGLVMTYATSLYNSEGNKLEDFKLSNLAHIKYVRPDQEMFDKIQRNYAFGSTMDLYLKSNQEQQAIISYPQVKGLIPTHLFETVEPLPGGKVLADIVTGTGEKTLAPGIIVSRYGKGKVAYISAALDAMYLQTHIPELAGVLVGAINYVSPEEPPYRLIDAPSGLIANMTASGDTRVLHLVNWTGSKLEKPHMVVDYITPIKDVTVEFIIPEGKQLSSVSLFEPAEFTQSQKGDVLQIHLSRIGQYQGVVIKLD